MPVTGYKTYTVAQPLETHTRAAMCREVECEAHTGGWSTLVNESTDLGARQAHYIRSQSGRAFTESLDAGVTTFSFHAGQECFAEHRVSLDRPQFHIVRGGDHRGNPTGDRYVHTSGDSWVDDFASHQETINKAING